MSNGDGGARGHVNLNEKSDARAPGSAPEHTDVHNKGSRLLELLQDAVVILLNITLLGMAFVFLYRVWAEIVAFGDLQEGLSNIIFVVITIELYRLSVHYLKYHRVDLNILVEVGVSAIIQKMILIGVDKFTMQQLVGISLILVALGAILWVHRREMRYDKPPTSPDAEAVADPQSTVQESQEARHVGPLRDHTVRE
jgi:uncharacterized membrane protein (DUF373 family)